LFLLLHVVGIVSVLQRVLPSGELAKIDLGLLGLFAGFSAAVKLTGLIVPLATACVVAGRLLIGERRALVGRALAFLLPAVAVIGFFYARPTFGTGNPFYPYYAAWFTDDEATLAMSEYHHDAGRKHFSPLPDAPLDVAKFFVSTPFLL